MAVLRTITPYGVLVRKTTILYMRPLYLSTSMGEENDPKQEFREYIKYISQIPQDVRKSVPKYPEDSKGAQVDNHVLLADIAALAEELGHPPNSREMDKEGHGKTQTYQERFGSYPAAMELVGFEPKFVSSRQKARYISEKGKLEDFLPEEDG